MKPPFDITEEILNLAAEVSVSVGRLVGLSGATLKNPTLRKKNRIRTVQGSLAIEQNTLTLEQVTAVLNGKTVLAPPKDIAEVKNAYEIYENMHRLHSDREEDLLAAHKIMLRGLAADAGEYRSIPVGVVNRQNQIIHFGTLPAYVPEAMENLLRWLRTTAVHPLIKGSVFHYEFELIHPFSDGNGRMGRLWHSLILAEWNPVFAWLPVESMVYKNQEEYYKVLNVCNAAGNSTAFITFMLRQILAALDEAAETWEQDEEQDEEQDPSPVDEGTLLDFCRQPRSREEMQAFCHIPGRKRFTANYLKPLLQSGRLVMTLPDKPNSKNQKYIAP